MKAKKTPAIKTAPESGPELPPGDTTQYDGEWIAVYHQQIIAHHKDLMELVKQVKKLNLDDQAPTYIRCVHQNITLASKPDRPSEDNEILDPDGMWEDLFD